MARKSGIEHLTPKERRFLSQLKEIVQHAVPEAEVRLYGSAARGEHGPESDYDILVLSDRALTSAEEDAVRDAVYDVELDHEVVVSMVFYSRAEWNSRIFRAMPFRQTVGREAVLI